MPSFDQLGLSPTLTKTLNKLGFSTPTQIQEQAIPVVMQGKDVLAGAQTGTGKTAAFGLPILNKILDASDERDRQSNDVLALIVVPTRELAQQVFESLTAYAESTKIEIVTAYGGTSINTQTRNLEYGCDVLVQQPGRLLDHLYCKNISLKKLNTWYSMKLIVCWIWALCLMCNVFLNR